MNKGALGHLEDGVVRLNEPTIWPNGQRVLVVPLAASVEAHVSPPESLLAEDAREFTPRHDELSSVNRDEL
jgi:hypothetical protein